jgi:hypothetical protein
VQFGLTWPQRILYVSVAVILSLLVVLYAQMVPGWIGILFVIISGLALGLISFFVTAAWVFRLTITEKEIRLNDRRKEQVIPTDKLGMLVRNTGFPFPSYWLVLRGAGLGQPIPVKGVEPEVQAHLQAYQRRNPGKTLTIVQLPGGYIRSARALAQTIKERFPPVLVDERLLK